MSEKSRLEIGKKLLAQFQEENNDGLPLHQQADHLAQTGQLQPALRLCWASVEIARRANDDDYISGAARFHMAVAYYLAGNQKEWDRAAELCEQAAHHFKARQARREQGLSLVMRSLIFESLCDAGLDRWQQALRAAAEAYTILRQVSNHLGEEALEAYGALGRKYVEKGLADEAAAKEAVTAASSEYNAAGASSGSQTHTKTDDTTINGGDANTDAAPKGNGAHTAAGSASYTNPGAKNPPPPTNNRTTPKTDPPPDNPPSASAAAATTIPTGLRSPRAVLENSFGWWRLAAIFGASLASGLVFMLAWNGLQSLLQLEPTLGLLFGYGVGIGFGVTVMSLGLLYATSQLIYNLLPNQVGVIIESRRIWTVEEPKRYWLFPFRQDLAAIIPLIPKPYEKFYDDVVLLDDRVLDVYIRADYAVSAADVFWNRVLSNLKRSRLLGIPRPLVPDTIQDELDKHAHALLGEAVVHVGNDETKRRLAGTQEGFKTQVMEYLNAESGRDGIHFENVVFRVMYSNRDGSL